MEFWGVSLCQNTTIYDILGCSHNEKFASESLHLYVLGVLAVVTESRAIIRRRYSKSFCGLLFFRASQGGVSVPGRRSNQEEQ